MLEHGGRLRQAAITYGIPIDDWLDLSTGLAPYSWPLPSIPAEAWQRLPEDDDGLEQVAQEYYQVESALPVAGSQAAIQALPALFSGRRVGLVEPCYAEHRHAWKRAGCTPVSLSGDEIEGMLDRIDVLVVVNPNNPTGRAFPPAVLLDWHVRLASRGGGLIVDEAFVDPTPEISLAPYTGAPGLIVLRSLGKFFGLGGARLGFVLAEHDLLVSLAEILGPWSISGPARHVGRHALADKPTQRIWRERMHFDSQRLARLLTAYGLAPQGGCALFQWIPHIGAAALHQALAEQGILTRLFDQLSALRIGLPGSDADWTRFESALAQLFPEITCPR
ncbi:threonine-phosphate decarboxylase CobD [Pseudomonas sp. OIL-1]|uniref:threonine-phosphate decarboxylase CobD n=1 Tax=Pseudomonas sp. OIL-1 TaxID=2706126 RepID=UPI0013A7AF99|nr:threonine-phosphate decarboxylase CobD [Pseudomonas sp. OIL-1]QIB49993.1 threonine-phosphate decarboxylase [Pseudomonas sp. OIL-1]